MLAGILNTVFLVAHISSGTSFQQPLTIEEEKECLEAFTGGSIEAKNTLIERNLRLVAHIAKKYHARDSEDLISIGTVGLIKAVASFDAQKGVRLATYASRCIENEIRMFLRASRKYNSDVYLQDPIGVDKDGNSITIEDKLADESYSIDEQVALRLESGVLRAAISRVLRARERLIVELRYGLRTGEEVTQREIAKALHISRSYVSRIEKKALAKLRNAMEGENE